MAIFKKRGLWWVGYRVNGKRRREPVGASYSLAKEVLAKRLTERAERKHFPGRVANAKPFEIVADKFWDLHGQHLESRSWAYMLKEVREEFKGKKIGAITAADVQVFYNKIAARTSPSTANKFLTITHSLFSKAKAWGDFFGDNPCGQVKRQREAPHRLRYLSTDEITALYQVAHPRLYPVLVCALMTGMRKGEILGLRWENVSLERSTIYILKAKSGKPREVPIAEKLREELEHVGPRAEGPVFDLPEIMLRRYFAEAVKAAKLPATGPDKVTLHTLRHSFASWFIMRTSDLPALQKLLGHSTPLLTMRYAHLSRGHMAANMATFEAGMPAKGWNPALGGHQRGHQAQSVEVGKA